MMEVLDPTLPAPADRRMPAPRPLSLEGVRIGVVDNGKPRSDAYLGALSELLEATRPASIELFRKPAIGRLLPPEQLAAVVASSDVVVTGVGDCSGCATCTVQDALDLEAAGVPTAVVCTDEFLELARRHAGQAGAPYFRFVVLEHPVATRSTAQLAELAGSSLDAVTAWLTGRSVTAGGVARAGGPAVGEGTPAGEEGPTCLC